MLQIDRIALSNKNRKVMIKVGSSKIDQKYLNDNEKITEYQEGKPCARRHLMMDAGEKSPCKYCRGDWDE